MTETDAPKVGIVMGSDSDLNVMNEAAAILKKFGIPYKMTVASAHRSPERAARFASSARDVGMKVIIAGAGHAAHLAGVLAAHTALPVIGVPIDSSCLQGWDSLLATVQMPPGIPVATMAIGAPGAANALAKVIPAEEEDLVIRAQKALIDVVQNQKFAEVLPEICSTLRQLSGEDYPDDPRNWVLWWQKQEEARRKELENR